MVGAQRLIWFLRSGTEDFGPCGPAISETDDIESWTQDVVTRWEKQHWPSPKKEVLPHETG